MTITNQKDLARLIDLCRKKGVDSIEIDNIKLTLGKAASKPVKAALPLADIPSQSYTPEDILNWSSTSLDGAF